jgi:hypothetical protein
MGNVQTQRLHIFLSHGLKEFDDDLSTQELFGIATRRSSLFFRQFDFEMQSHFGNLWLQSLTMIAFLFGSQQIMKGIEAPRPFGNAEALLKFEFVLVHAQAGAMITNAADRFHHDRGKSLMVDRSGQFQMTKVPRVALVVQISQPGIIGTSIDGLALHLRFVPGHTRRDFAAIHRNGLSHRILPLQLAIRI